MTRMGVYDQLKKMFQDIIAPELHALRADIQRVETSLGAKIDGVDIRLTSLLTSLRTETVSMKGELLSEIRRLDTRIDGVEARIGGVDARIEGLDRQLQIAIDIRERLAALEARRPS